MDEIKMTDAEALDRMAEFFRLPDWSIGDSWCDFIDCLGEIVGQVRDITIDPDPAFAAETGHDPARETL